MSANASGRLANTALEKAIVHKKTGLRSGQYFIFMVISVAASSFVLFHDARSLELLRMMLPRTRVGNFGVKKFRCPTASTNFFYGYGLLRIITSYTYTFVLLKQAY